MAAGLLALAGCTTPAGRPAPLRPSQEIDPLVGGVPIPDSNASRSPAAPRDDLKPGALPPLESGSPTSPAALTRPPGKAAGEARPATPGASLGGPVPKVVPGGEAPGALTQTGASVPAATGVETYEQLQEKLKARGVVWQQLKNDNLRPEQWLFVCAIPDRNNRDLRSVYEGEGAGPVAAMRAALDRIERERR